MSELVKASYQDLAVSFTEDGWINATDVAEKFGKRVNDFLALPSTKEYLEALSDLHPPPQVLNTGKSGNYFFRAKRGKHGGGTWMHPDLVVLFARWIDVRFAVWCDQQIKKLLSGKHPHHDTKRLRHQAASSYKVMAQILQMTRERLGKTCAPHHFSNEARLINWALTGEFGKVDRSTLSNGDLDLLAKLENLDTILIGCGADYDHRKGELERFAAEQRTHHPHPHIPHESGQPEAR